MLLLHEAVSKTSLSTLVTHAIPWSIIVSSKKSSSKPSNLSKDDIISGEFQFDDDVSEISSSASKDHHFEKSFQGDANTNTNTNTNGFSHQHLAAFAPKPKSVVSGAVGQKSTIAVSRTIDMRRFSVALHLQNLYAWHLEDFPSSTLLYGENETGTEADSYPISIEIDSKKRVQNLTITGTNAIGINQRIASCSELVSSVRI